MSLSPLSSNHHIQNFEDKYACHFENSSEDHGLKDDTLKDNNLKDNDLKDNDLKDHNLTLKDEHTLKDSNMMTETEDIDLSSPRARAIIISEPAIINVINIDSQSSPMIDNQSKHFSNNSLDEPIYETILRDLRKIAIKLRLVLYPKGNQDVLRDWDLWGPLIFCLTLSTLLSAGASDQGISVFTGVFVIVWSGAAIVTINAKLLGGKISFFQSICILGYCVFPLVLVAFIDLFIGKKVYIRLPLSIMAFAWSSWASVNFISTSHLTNRRALVIYPLFLFYFLIGWIVLIF
ncbi:Yip1-domain-containing protein [Gigaspora margarita]|uniref:Protein YIP n=1 Tax=Gigaspora margarita TaxID=4874 RepID=A0A8H3XAG0_GIGMA|nr:Yip1-domain-containing protein [Gigaspora margarita]